MSPSARLVCATFAAISPACAGAPDANTSSRQEAVIGGEISGADDDFVVRIASRQPEPYQSFGCSGTLLAPNLMMTALHCVAVFDGFSNFSCDSDGSLASSPGGGWIGETLDPGQIDVYFGTSLSPTVAARAASVLGSGSTAICVDDIAFVVLDTALPVPGVPVRLERPVVEGEQMTVIGYGLNDWRDTPRARRSQVPVLDVGPDDSTDGSGTIAPRTFVVGDGPCKGESGAPALSDETGAVTGVFMYNFSGDCTMPGTRGLFTKLSPFANLLHRAFEAAAENPRLEALPSAAAPPDGSRASCAVNAGGGRPGLWAPALGALTVLFARRARARPRSASSTRRS